MNILGNYKLSIETMMDFKRDRCIGIVIGILLYFVSINKFEMYTLIGSIMNTSTIVGFIYVNFIKSKYVDKRKVSIIDDKDLNLYYIVVINIVNIIFILLHREFKYYFITYCIQSIVEYTQVQKMYNFKNTLVNKILMYMIYMLNVSTFYVLLLRDSASSRRGEICIISILFAINYISILLYNNILVKNRDKMINLYLLSIVLNYFSSFFINIRFNFIGCMIMLIKAIVFFKFYKYTIDLIFEDSMNIMTDNVNKARKRKRNLNTVLKKRNIILSETNAIIEKKQDKYRELIESVYGGVFMFVDDKLRYSNDIEKNLNISEKSIIGIDFNEFLIKYFNINAQCIGRKNNYIPSIYMNYNNLEVEVFLTSADDNVKILYIHDKTQIKENIEAKRELEEYLVEDEVKQEFFARISHELKTPINNIYTAIQLNDVHLDEKNLKSCDSNRKIIKENCLKLIRIINNFIDFNKISEGYIVPNIKTYNIVSIIEDTIESCTKYVLKAQSKVIFETDAKELLVKCDDDMINRIILNIITSIIKQGRKDVTIYIKIIEEANDNIEIKIISEGLKADKKIIPCIFDEHTKVDKIYDSLKESGELGLFLVRALIALQDGQINLDIADDNYNFEINFKCEKELLSKEQISISTINLEEKAEMEFADLFIE